MEAHSMSATLAVLMALPWSRLDWLGVGDQLCLMIALGVFAVAVVAGPVAVIARRRSE